MLQKVVMTSMGDLMATQGIQYFDQAAGGLTPDQKKKIDADMARYRECQRQREQNPSASQSSNDGSLVAMKIRDVVGENKKSPMVAFYAVGIGVMFLLFTASAAGGSLLDESDSGTLDRVLSSRVTMTTLLAGK